jgi:hypothetical protein
VARSRVTLLGAVCLALVCGGAPRAFGLGESFVDSIYSAEGIELRADIRVFNIMAVMNAMGWREDTRALPPPTKMALLPPLRTKLIQEIGALSPALREALQVYFTQRPEPVERYLLAALAFDPMQADNAQHAASWSDWNKLSDKFMTEKRMPDIASHFAPDYKAEMLRRMSDIDLWTKAVLDYLRIDDSCLNDPVAVDNPRRVIYVLNLVGPYATNLRIDVDNFFYVIAGADEKPTPQALMAAWLAAMLAPRMDGRAGHWEAYTAAWTAESAKRPLAPGFRSMSDWVAENLARSIAMHVFAPRDQHPALLRAEAEAGYPLTASLEALLKTYETGDASFLVYLDQAWAKNAKAGATPPTPAGAQPPKGAIPEKKKEPPVGRGTTP